MSGGSVAPSCLLVVDLQHQFLNMHTRHLGPKIQARLADFDWVFCSRLVPEPGGSMARWKRYQPAAADTASAQLALDFSLRPSARTHIIEKTGLGALTADARARLVAAGVSEVHLCGVDTDLCIMRTAGDVLEMNLRPIILTGLCASTAGPEQHRFGLITLRRMVGAAQMQ